MDRVPESKVYGAVTVGERGQVVIPAKIRRHFRISPGDRLIVFAKERGPIAFIPAREFSRLLDQTASALAKMKTNGASSG